MSSHTAKLTHNLNIDLGEAGTDIQLRADGDLLGTLTLRGGSVDWRPANAHHVLNLTWSEFAKLMNEKYARSR